MAATHPPVPERDAIDRDFHKAVNMAPAELERWLDTDEDVARMRKVLGDVHRHPAQGGPAQDVETSPWRHALVNWGHEPLED